MTRRKFSREFKLEAVKLVRDLQNPFCLVTQIVGQRAIAVDLATVEPSLTEQLGLPCVVLRTVA